MKYTFGASVSEDELAELGELRKLTASLIADTFSNPLVKVPFYKYFPTDTNRRLAEFKRRWKAFIDRYRKMTRSDRFLNGIHFAFMEGMIGN